MALNLFRSRFTNLTNSEPYLLEEHTGIEQCLGSVSCQKEEEKGERGREGGGGRWRGEGEGDGEGEREGGKDGRGGRKMTICGLQSLKFLLSNSLQKIF